MLHRYSILILCIISTLYVALLYPITANAQEKINNEYRITLVPTYSVSNKIFLTTYLGYVNNQGSKTTSYYLGAPFIAIYRPNKIVEIMGGAFLVFNKVKEGNDNTEFRPLAGLKLTLPNTNKLNIFNWTRYEYRSFYYDDESLDNVKNRIRNRVAIEFPISKNAWQPKSYYGFSDFEFFYTFEKGYFDRFRQRFGMGYVVNSRWRAELIYHIQMLKSSKDENPEWTDNIFRLNLKWSIPHKKHEAIEHAPGVDD